MTNTSARSAFIARHPAASLFALAFVLGTAPLLLVHLQVLPTGYAQLGALSASAAGFVLATLEGGWPRLRELLRRGLIWRVGFGWWMLALLYTGAIAAAAIYLTSAITGHTVDWASLPPFWQIVPMMLVLIILAGLGEEFGWRGYLVPRLQRRHSALTASLIIGAFHSLWHIPLFLVDGTAQYEWTQQVGFLAAFLGYALFVVAWAVQLSWFFNNTQGSVLIAAVVHGAGNAWIGGYLDVSGQAGIAGNTTLAVLMLLVSICVVAVAGPRHMTRRST